MKKYNKTYIYAGYMQSAKGYNERHYQEVTDNGLTTINEPFTAEHFQDIVDYYNDMSEVN